MEAMLISRAVDILVSKLQIIITEGKKLRKELKEDLEFIKCDMQMMNKAVEKHAESEELRWWVLQVQKLAYDMEDTIDMFRGRVTSRPGAGSMAQALLGLKNRGAVAKFAEEIRSLRKRAIEVVERRDRFLGNAPPSAPEPHPGPSSTDPYILEDKLVGVAEPKRRLLELLGERLRVITIVGGRGIGKSTLARVVFESWHVRCRAWVVASDCKDARALLGDILFKLLGRDKDDTASLVELSKSIKTYLQAQPKYLIVIDDMNKEVWQDIESSFPDDTNGRILVTTSIQSIAKACSSDGGYLYRMQALDRDNSKKLLLQELSRSQHDFEGSEIILKKCDGLPLFLVNVAQLLKKSEDRLTGTYCSEVCRDLGFQLQKEALPRMKQVLIHSYDNLPGHDLKTCLLSISIFPKDHQIKRKTLIRRWLAEGLVVKHVVASDYFEELIDRSIIQAVQPSNDAAVKSCQVHNIVLDFIAHKSDAEKFITFIHNNETIPDKNDPPRRLLVNTAAETRGLDEIDLSHIRSLTIFGHVGHYINFQKCKLLRVLDLQNCADLEESDIKKICGSKLLKYLSLRGTSVSKIPRQISNLHHLETLDIRETNISMLPIEVLKLPWLTHLFGQFNLPSELDKVSKGHKVQTFFSKRSRLQTLAGFVIDENRGIQQLLVHISTLRKIKVWSKDTPSQESIDLLISSLMERFSSDNTLKSLSIDFGDNSIGFLDKFKTPSSLTSVKLHGKLTKLPDFISSLNDLELHLSSTALSEECLMALQSLNGLLYLKLVGNFPEFVDGNFTIESTGFPRLQRFCIQTSKLPKMNIQKGAMQHLTSLRLLCEDISGFPLHCICHIEHLKEVTLFDDFICQETREDWDIEAKQHKNRPEIMYQMSEIIQTKKIW